LRVRVPCAASDECLIIAHHQTPHSRSRLAGVEVGLGGLTGRPQAEADEATVLPGSLKDRLEVLCFAVPQPEDNVTLALVRAVGDQAVLGADVPVVALLNFCGARPVGADEEDGAFVGGYGSGTVVEVRG